MEKNPSMSGMYNSPRGDQPAPAAGQSNDLEECWAEASLLSVPGHRTKWKQPVSPAHTPLFLRVSQRDDTSERQTKQDPGTFTIDCRGFLGTGTRVSCRRQRGDSNNLASISKHFLGFLRKFQKPYAIWNESRAQDHSGSLCGFP